MKLAVLSNINMNILTKKLSRIFDVYQPEGYGNFLEEMLNPASGLNRFSPEIVFIILDGKDLIDRYKTTNIMSP